MNARRVNVIEVTASFERRGARFAELREELGGDDELLRAGVVLMPIITEARSAIRACVSIIAVNTVSTGMLAG